MAQFSHLPIYKKAYDLALFIHRFAVVLPREHRYTFGAKLKESGLCLLLLIIRANSRREKSTILEDTSEELEKLKILIRLGRDLEIIGMKKYEECARLFEEIGKQLGGWIKSQSRNKNISAGI
ncbi:MAG: diversity-generating retroelement protein Avd [Patescibacteria group bacterium]